MNNVTSNGIIEYVSSFDVILNLHAFITLSMILIIHTKVTIVFSMYVINDCNWYAWRKMMVLINRVNWRKKIKRCLSWENCKIHNQKTKGKFVKCAYTCSLITVVLCVESVCVCVFFVILRKLSIPFNCANCRIATDPVITL